MNPGTTNGTSLVATNSGYGTSLRSYRATASQKRVIKMLGKFNVIHNIIFRGGLVSAECTTEDTVFVGGMSIHRILVKYLYHEYIVQSVCAQCTIFPIL